MTVTLSNAAIDALIDKPGATAAFPILLATVRRKRCDGCPGQRTVKGIDYAGIRAAVAAMATPRREAFKMLLAADTICIVFPSGRTVTI